MSKIHLSKMHLPLLFFLLIFASVYSLPFKCSAASPMKSAVAAPLDYTVPATLLTTDSTIQPASVLESSALRPIQIRQADPPVFFVTDRELAKSTSSIKFNNNRSSEMTFGKYVADPSAAHFSKENLSLIYSERQFLQGLKAAGATNIAVLVHGYNESFNDSIDDGMQMAKHLHAPLVVFSWPSKDNACSYIQDECAGEWSSHHLSSLLADLGQNFGFSKITLIAHSMGARVVTWSLKDLYAAENRPVEKFAAALFIAPDMDKGVFIHNTPFLKQACSTCRVFVDSHDSHLLLSKILHGSDRVNFGEKGESVGMISQFFDYDGSLPSHDFIPYATLFASMHDFAAPGKTN